MTKSYVSSLALQADLIYESIMNRLNIVLELNGGDVSLVNIL